MILSVRIQLVTCVTVEFKPQTVNESDLFYSLRFKRVLVNDPGFYFETPVVGALLSGSSAATCRADVTSLLLQEHERQALPQNTGTQTVLQNKSTFLI